ncbi:MAG: hypothetical protein ACX94B_04145 [Henriciella sp.]
MFKLLSSVLNGTRTAIHVGACLLIGVMMGFVVGLPLIFGGRPEGWITLVIGSMAFLTAGKEIFRVSRSGL